MAKDFYNVLGVSKNASAEEIKEAYKNLAKKFHPDVSKEQNAEAKFKEVLEAYHVLSDNQKRTNYDRFGDAAEKFSGFGGFGGQGGFSNMEFDFGDIFSGFGGGGMGDLFKEAFAQSRGRSGSQRGEDLATNMQITFEEAAFGAKKEIEIEIREICNKCNGDGTAKRDGKKTCHTCRGSGTQQSMQRTFFGTLATSTTCRTCSGTGQVITDPCEKCGGKKVVRAKKKITVNVPAGVNSGNNLRLRGLGNSGAKGGASGDLFVVIFVEPHKIFKRDKNDIFMEIPISFSEAALGAEIVAPTLRKPAKIKMPSGTQSGTIFRLKEQGIKGFESSKLGDQFVKVIINTPKSLSKKQKELFEELAKTDGKKGGKEGLFDGLKKHL